MQGHEEGSPEATPGTPESINGDAASIPDSLEAERDRRLARSAQAFLEAFRDEETIGICDPIGEPPDDGPSAPLEVYAKPAILPDWPEPTNIFAELAAPPFTASVLPAELAEYPSLYSAQTGIDISIVLTAAIVCAAAALSDQIQLCADSSSHWFAQARLWLLLVGSPGAGKSPGQRAMLAPLWQLHGELDEQWRKAVQSLAEDDSRLPRPRLIVGDATLEALSDVLVDNPRGPLVATDEFDAWLGAMDQYRGGGIGRDRGEWLRLFDGGPHSIERVKRGTVFVPNWGVSILTATTPAAMTRLSKHLPEDGLIQRFLVVLARRQVLAANPPAAAEIEAARKRYTETIRRLWALTPRAHNGVVSLSFEAKQRFNLWRAENLKLQEAFGSLDPALEGHVAKYPTIALRLALIFHAARIVNLDHPQARDPAAWPVPVDTLETALTFLDRASQHSLALYLGRQGGSAYELARAIARLIVAKPPEANAKGLERRDIIRRVKAFRDADSSFQAAALNLLCDLGWLKQSDEGYRKEHVTRFSVNPEVNVRFAELGERERERRALVRERIAQSAEDRRSDG